MRDCYVITWVLPGAMPWLGSFVQLQDLQTETIAGLFQVFEHALSGLGDDVFHSNVQKIHDLGEIWILNGPGDQVMELEIRLSPVLVVFDALIKVIQTFFHASQNIGVSAQGSRSPGRYPLLSIASRIDVAT